MQPLPTTATRSRASAAPFWQRRAVVIAIRTTAIVAGVAGAAAGLFFAGLISALSVCDGDASGLCTNFAGVVPALEWLIVIVAFAAPLAGGIASARRLQWPWLPAGLATSAAMVWLAVVVSAGQTGTLS